MPRTVASHAEAAQPAPAWPPGWPLDPLCPQPRRRVPPRLLAAALLSLLAVRLAMRMAKGNAGPHLHGLVFSIAAALALLTLGGCLWWVAKRQIGLPGALIALTLFVAAPIPNTGAYTALASLGVFGIVYTGVGVTHALQGPRRKWPPRIIMMSGLTAFTAVFDLDAAWAALALSLLAMLYLAERRRFLLPPLMFVWACCAQGAWAVAHLLRWPHALSHSAVPPLPLFAHPATILLSVALAASIIGWAASRRSRYFGNSAPLLAALLLCCLYPFVGTHALTWALPFALLFVAGVTADWLPHPL